MCTNPLKNVEDIDDVIFKLDMIGADSVCSVVRVWDYHPSRVKFIKGNKMKDVYHEKPVSYTHLTLPTNREV